MAAYIFNRFLAAVRAVAARCKLSFAIRPALSHEDNKTKSQKKGAQNIFTPLPQMP
jgi:hypothetical protein